jgi:hypothetical protein
MRINECYTIYINLPYSPLPIERFIVLPEGKMTAFQDFFTALYTMPLEQAIFWSLLGNVVMFAAALLAGEVLVRR